MLNYCIQRKRERYEQSSKPVSASSSSASLKARPSSQSSKSKQSSTTDPQKQSKWEVETAESDSEDEFFEAVEEQDRECESPKNEEMDTISPRDSDTDRPKSPKGSASDIQSQDVSPSGSFMSLNKSASDIVLERTGVLKETDMLLLETNEPLCIPITQV